jgi:putative membrane protein
MMRWDVHQMGVGGWLVMVLIAGVVLGSVGWLVARSLAPRATGSVTPVERAEEVLDGRFARGDIDEATYRARRAALRDR